MKWGSAESFFSFAPLQCDCIWFGLLFLTFLLSLGWLYIGLILLNDLHNFNECVTYLPRFLCIPTKLHPTYPVLSPHYKSSPALHGPRIPALLMSLGNASKKIHQSLETMALRNISPSLPSNRFPGWSLFNSQLPSPKSPPPLEHLPLPSYRFLFRHWGHWMDWSLIVLLVISILVTYASLLLVGPGTSGLTPT